MACNDYQMYWTFVGGAFAAIMLLWPVLILAVFAFGRHRPFASEREIIIQNMERAMRDGKGYLHRSPQWVEVRVPKSDTTKSARKSKRVASGTRVSTKTN